MSLADEIWATMVGLTRAQAERVRQTVRQAERIPCPSCARAWFDCYCLGAWNPEAPDVPAPYRRVQA